MSADADAKREQIKFLLADGLGTEAFPRTDTHEEVQDVVRRLREADDSGGSGSGANREAENAGKRVGAHGWA